ncbi:hypothetical protein CKAH01_16449 [Colletotrichum kahawae]|uniref:Transmembrane protein n=1 Tax=Colletotrichum kahawae TaxID=34407 RepID=A0AAD9YFI2_COLKA|nr:hypothetical protein CKAH01_16449 [Colletotrichum kahawae]
MASTHVYHQSPLGPNGTSSRTHPLIVGDTALEFWLSFLAFAVVFFIIPILLWCAYIHLRNITRIKNDELCGKHDSCRSTHLRAMDLWMLFAFVVLGPVVVAAAIISVIIVIPYRLFTGLTRRGIDLNVFVAPGVKKQPDDK